MAIRGHTLAAAQDHIQVSGKRNLRGLVTYFLTREYSGLPSLLVQGTKLPLGLEEEWHPYFTPGFSLRVRLLLKIEGRTALLLPTPPKWGPALSATILCNGSPGQAATRAYVGDVVLLGKSTDGQAPGTLRRDSERADVLKTQSRIECTRLPRYSRGTAMC